MAGGAAAVALAVLLPVAVLAGDGNFGQVNWQQHELATDGAQTARRSWRPIPGLKDIGVDFNPGQPLGVSVNLTARGAPFQVRVLLDGDPLQPAAARFEPVARNRSFSFVFLEGSATGQDVDVQWRSPSGERVRLAGGLANLLFSPE